MTLSAARSSYWPMFQSIAYLAFRRKRKEFLIGVPTLLVLIAFGRLALPALIGIPRAVPVLSSALFLVAWMMFAFTTKPSLPTGLPGPSNAPLAAMTPPTYPRSYFTLPAPTWMLSVAPWVVSVAVDLALWFLFLLTQPKAFGGPLATCIPLIVAVALAGIHWIHWLMQWKPMLAALIIMGTMLSVAGVLLPLRSQHVIETLSAEQGNFLFAIAPPLLITMCGCFLTLGFIAASHARCGDLVVPNSQMDPTKAANGSKKPKKLAKIENAIDAQVWFDRRLNGACGIEVLVGLICLLALVRLALSDGDRTNLFFADGIRVSEETAQFVYALLICAFFSFISSIMFLVPLRNTAIGGGKTREISQMVLILPMTTVDFLRVRLMNTARSAFRVSVILVLALIPWLLTSAEENGRVYTLLGLVYNHLGSKASIAIPLAVLLLPFALFSMQLGNALDTPIIGNKAPSFKEFPVQAMVFMSAGVGAMLTLVPMSHMTTHLIHPPSSTLAIIPVVILVPKALLTLASVRRLIQRQVVPTRIISAAAAGWVGCLAALSGLTYWLLPSDSIALPILCAWVAVFLPINRILSPLLVIDAARPA